MIIHRMNFKTCEVLEVCWILVGFSKIFMVSVFSGHLVLWDALNLA